MKQTLINQLTTSGGTYIQALRNAFRKKNLLNAIDNCKTVDILFCNFFQLGIEIIVRITWLSERDEGTYIFIIIQILLNISFYILEFLQLIAINVVNDRVYHVNCKGFFFLIRC